MIWLKSAHVYLDSQLVNSIFEDVDYAYVSYIASQQKLLITPVTSLWFPKMYAATQFLLKTRNLKGDKTLAIREILIDHDLDLSDRNLEYEVITKTKLVKITL